MSSPTFTPAKIAAAFPPITIGKKKSNQGPSGARPLVQIEPPFLGVLRALGLPVDPNAKDVDGGVLFTTGCPWFESHSDGHQDANGGYLVAHHDGVARAWGCHHGHCVDRGLVDILKMAGEQNIPIPDGALNIRTNRTDLPVVLVGANEAEVVEQVEVILAANPDIYIRGGRIVHVELHSTGGALIQDATNTWIGLTIAQCINLEKNIRTRGGGLSRTRTLVPTWLPPMAMAKPGRLYREIFSVSDAPRFMSDGSIHATPGELKEGVLYTGPAGFPGVPERPSQTDAQAAYKRFMMPFSEVPFASPEHRAAWFAALATVVARPAVLGPVPAVASDANTGGSGKGLIANCGHLISTGRMMTVTPCPKSEEEFRKAALTWVLGGAPIQVLDEVPNPLGHGAMNALVTSPTYGDRVLGTSTTVSAQNRVVIWLIGNNIAVAGETMRRCLYFRLEPMDERPEDRVFRIPDLLGYVEEHRIELLHDLLIVMKAFHAAGRPASGLKVWGGFAAWSSLIRDCVYWATGLDIDCRESLANVGDPDRREQGDLLVEIQKVFGTKGTTVAELIERSFIYPSLRSALDVVCPAKDGRISHGAVGKKLASYRRRPVNGLYIDQAPGSTRTGVVLWCVRQLIEIPLKTAAVVVSLSPVKKRKYA